MLHLFLELSSSACIDVGKLSTLLEASLCRKLPDKAESVDPILVIWTSLRSIHSLTLSLNPSNLINRCQRLELSVL